MWPRQNFLVVEEPSKRIELLQENAIAIIGVGYVGLPLALSLAKFHPKVFGYDLDSKRVSELNSGFDRNDNICNVVPSNLSSLRNL